MKLIILFILATLFASSVGLYLFVYKYPYYILEFQLEGKNLEYPEKDAKKDLEQGNVYCYSTAGYARGFPGAVSKEDYEICNRGTEIEFFGDSCIVEGDRHKKALDNAYHYALRYNLYVLTAVAKQRI